jgi:hypothetical protein
LSFLGLTVDYLSKRHINTLLLITIRPKHEDKHDEKYRDKKVVDPQIGTRALKRRSNSR